MTDDAAVPVFGAAPAGAEVRSRRAAYALVRRGDGRVAAVRGRAGDAPLWLPGGGVEPGETEVEAVARELREELGWSVTALTPAGRATQHFWSGDDGCWYRMDAAFFHARVLPVPPETSKETETVGEHPLEWQDPSIDGARFFHACHAWAASRPPPPSADERRIRAKAVAVVVEGGRVLAERCADRATGERFLRAIGGHIEFGEAAVDAAAREWHEEYGLAIRDLALLGVIENRFTYEGEPGHEIVFAFRASLPDDTVAARDEWTSVDGDGGAHHAVWAPLADVASGAIRLVPAGLGDLLRGLT